MRAIAINGSPRKEWNTATLLQNALSGCTAAGADTEIVHLYDPRLPGLHQLLRLQAHRREELRPMRGARRTHPSAGAGGGGRRPDPRLALLLPHGDR